MSEQTENPMTTLTGEEEALAEFRDGRREKVTLRVITVREIPKFLDLVGDESALLEMLTGQETGWADPLTPESFDQLVSRGVALNNPIIESWMSRQHRMTNWGMEKLAPMLKNLSESHLKAFAQGRPSSQASPSGK